jgi:aldose 1-epimerase
MIVDQGVFWRKEYELESNLEFIILGYRDEVNSDNNLEAWIAPSHGSNLCRLSVGGKNVIDFERELLLKSDFTGTPVLYPTPNKVRNGVFKYQGKTYAQVKRGITIYEHGLVHDEPWEYQEPETSGDSVCLKTWIDFEESTPIFQAFPFKHRLSLEFRLMGTGVKVSYTIENMDDQAIPFGFGLHPYFMKLSGDDGTFVELPADCVMDATSDLLPTGMLVDVSGTCFDLRDNTKIGALDFDHVFTGLRQGKHAQVEYESLGMRVRLVSTPDFSHLVLYSPHGKVYFCLENQTCSTDAHNLYDRGFKTQSGLKFVPAGKIHTGSVTYVVMKG